MKRRSLVAAILAVTTATAMADPHKVLVLQSEGRADGAVRARVDASIMKLAKSIPSADVSPGDTSLGDAAAAVGCRPETPACRDEILSMLGVDELIYANLTTKPGGTEIEVHRASKGSTVDGKMTLATGQDPDKLDKLAPLFGAEAVAVTTTTTTPTEPVTTTPTTTPTEPATKPTEPLTTPQPPLVTTQPGQPTQTPAQPSDTPSRSRQHLELAGMIGGGALVLIGFMCWGSANDIQSQINEAPTQTKPQLDALADLESRGDSYASWGNALFLGGAVLGGISTYFFIRDRRARGHATSARITPTVIDHGAGLALTLGAP
jgi:cell division septation protein DedD